MKAQLIFGMLTTGCYARPQAPSPFVAADGQAALDLIRNTPQIPFGPAPKGCSAHEMIVARGTGEPGPFGVIVGDPLVTAVLRLVPEARGYAVQYPANMNASSPAIGADDTINRLNNQHKECPQQNFVLIGYSQGAGVIHRALGPPGEPYVGGPAVRPKLNPEVLSKIKALVMFGDGGFKGTVGGPNNQYIPPFPASLQDVLRQNCAEKDTACDPRGGSFEHHLEYVGNPWQQDSLDFVVAAFKGQPLPKAPKTPKDYGWGGKI